MNGQFRRKRWVAILFVAIIATVVGLVAYNAGVAHGVAISGAVAGAVERDARGAMYPYPYPYAFGWHPWGFGFGGFGFFFPFLFFGLWFLAFRFLFWGGPWRRRHWHEGGPHDLPPAFDEWHRRAHERMNTAPDENRAGRG